MVACTRLPIAVAIGLLSGCATINVNIEKDPSAPVRSYQTFGWYEGIQGWTGNPRLDQPQLHARIRFEISRHLTEKKYSQTQGTRPDLLVAYAVALQTKRQWSAVKLGDKYVPAWGQGTWSNRNLGSPGMYVREYEQGTLVLDFVDATTSRLIWRGTARTNVDPSEPHTAQEQKIKAVVRRLMNHFPRSRSSKRSRLGGQQRGDRLIVEVGVDDALEVLES